MMFPLSCHSSGPPLLDCQICAMADHILKPHHAKIAFTPGFDPFVAAPINRHMLMPETNKKEKGLDGRRPTFPLEASTGSEYTLIRLHSSTVVT